MTTQRLFPAAFPPGTVKRVNAKCKTDHTCFQVLRWCGCFRGGWSAQTDVPGIQGVLGNIHSASFCLGVVLVLRVPAIPAIKLVKLY
jgi:hypothetical protein